MEQTIKAGYGKAEHQHKLTLYADCPYCHVENDDDFERDDPTGTNCVHFVKVLGGCGAYAFVFDKSAAKE